MNELEFLWDFKKLKKSLDSKTFLKYTSQLITICDESINFFENEKIEIPDGKILVISFDKKIIYRICDFTNEKVINQIANQGSFYFIYGNFDFNHKNELIKDDRRLFFGTTRGCIKCQINPFILEEDSFVYKIKAS